MHNRRSQGRDWKPYPDYALSGGACNSLPDLIHHKKKSGQELRVLPGQIKKSLSNGNSIPVTSHFFNLFVSLKFLLLIV
jgi:hypothetical protein